MKIWCLDFTGRGCKDAEECSTSSGRPGSTECVAAALESIYPGTDTVRKKCISGSHEGTSCRRNPFAAERSSCRAGRRAGHRRNRKHWEAELRALRAILIQYEGIDTHHFDIKQKNNHVLLVTNRNHRGILENQTGGKVHPLGVIVQTDDLLQLLQIRTYRDMLF